MQQGFYAEAQTTKEPRGVPNRALTIGAHPDDAEFGAGGTLAAWASAGCEVTMLVVTDGSKGSWDSAATRDQLIRQRVSEQQLAARHLGANEPIMLGHVDGELEYSMALRSELCLWIRRIRPDVVLTHDPWQRYQLHPDHRAAGQAALDAIYAAREWYIFPEQLVGDVEPWRVKEVYLFWTGEPDYWEDITCCMEARISALTRHASQVGLRMDNLAERVYERSREAGEKAGFEYAEGFKRVQF